MKNKIVIAPSYQVAIAHGFKREDVIVRRYTAMATVRDIGRYIFIDGEEYDYPPIAKEYVELKKEIHIRCGVKYT